MSRRGLVRRVGVLIFVTNVLLAIAKIVVWVDSGSLAVGSEAVNSLTDTIYGLVVLGGLYLTTRPPDFDHPHGHERIEPFVSLFIAVGIFGAGTVVLWQALVTIIDGTPGPQIGLPAIGVLGGSAIIKFVLYQYALDVGESQQSPAVVAMALDNRNDVFTAVAALIGVAGVQSGFPVLDPLAAVIVSFGIYYTGFEIIRDNINYLIGRAPSQELREEIIHRALAQPEVKGVHEVIAHYVGPEVDVSLHIEVEGDLTLLEAHDIETAVAESIRALPGIDDVFVHIDPKELGEWKPDPDVDRLLEQNQESDRSRSE